MTEAVDRSGQRVNAGRGMFVILLMAALISVGVFFALSQRGSPNAVVATGEAKPVPVGTVRLGSPETLSIDEAFAGIVVAARETSLGFERGGRIAELKVDVGDRVEAGVPLGRLDTRALSAELRAIEAQISEATTGRDLAQATLDRLDALAADQLAPAQALDEALSARDASDARIRSGIASADALRVQIALSQLVAPFSGTITGRFVDEGAIAAPGQAILRLVETNALEIRIGLPADVADALVLGQTYAFASDGGEVQAELVRSTNLVDAQSRTVELVFEVLDADTVRSGQIVRLAQARDVTETGHWVPLSALSESSRGLWTVYVAEDVGDGADRAVTRFVEIVHSTEGFAFVRGSLVEGDHLILEGLGQIVPGVRVAPGSPSLSAQLSPR